VERGDDLVQGVLALLLDPERLLGLALRLELVSLELIALGLDALELILDVLDDTR
jgi:hypothetical protein